MVYAVCTSVSWISQHSLYTVVVISWCNITLRLGLRPVIILSKVRYSSRVWETIRACWQCYHFYFCVLASVFLLSLRLGRGGSWLIPPPLPPHTLPSPPDTGPTLRAAPCFVFLHTVHTVRKFSLQPWASNNTTMALCMCGIEIKLQCVCVCGENELWLWPLESSFPFSCDILSMQSILSRTSCSVRRDEFSLPSTPACFSCP